MTRCLLAGLMAITAPCAVSAQRELPILFKTNFADKNLDRWDFTDAKAWKLAEHPGGYALNLFGKPQYSPKVRSPLAIAWLKEPAVSDFQLDVKVKSTTRDYGHRDLCIFFGRRDAEHFYYVHFGKEADPHAHSIFLVNGKPRVSIASDRTKGTPWTNDWHRVRVTHTPADGAIRVYFDDMAKPIMQATDKTFPGGRVGLGSFDDTGMFTDFVLRGPSVTRTADVIYGRKFGTALTMDVFAPKEKPNGAGAIFVVSGGWFSAHEAIATRFVTPLTDRGYTVFAVVHGSQPRFTIPEILGDMNRAVRYIRRHAKDYGVDPGRLGIYGASAGGHLSLMQGTAGNAGDPKARDPVDRESSRVQAVACFFPPTDFLNYGKPGENAIGRGVLSGFKAPFDFHEPDPKTKTFVKITDETKIVAIGRNISPIAHVSSDDAPTLIIHGDADKLVPIQQAESFLAKLKAAGVPAKLVTKPGAAHGWPNLDNDLSTIADWFDQHLKKNGP